MHRAAGSGFHATQCVNFAILHLYMPKLENGLFNCIMAFNFFLLKLTFSCLVFYVKTFLSVVVLLDSDFETTRLGPVEWEVSPVERT